MSRYTRVRTECIAEFKSFTRRRTALFFTLIFPILLVLVFVAAIRAGEGTFLGADASYFLPGYAAIVLVFAPLSRVAGSVPRDRAAARFDKLATTPLRRWEYLAARVIVAGGLAAIPVAIVLGAGVTLTPTSANFTPWLVPLSIAVLATFAGLGAIIGRLADSEDGAIAIANAIGFPIAFFSETLLPPTVFPDATRWIVELSPVTHYARAMRATFAGATPDALAVALVLVAAGALFAIGAASVPTTSR